MGFDARLARVTEHGCLVPFTEMPRAKVEEESMGAFWCAVCRATWIVQFIMAACLMGK
jgi:hypothetical protein